jgi:two-component system KDP operon response regulator KdpE
MTDAIGHLVIVHARSAKARAVELAAQLRLDGFDAELLAVTGALIEALSHADPDFVVISFVTGSFNVARLCRDLSGATDWRLVVVVGDAGSRDSDLVDDFVVDVLDAGADAVISQSVSRSLLLARLRAVMRTPPRPKPELPPVVVGDVVIDVAARSVRIGGSIVRLVRLKYELLLVLANHVDRAVSADQLLVDVWGVPPGSVDPQRLRIAISGLRRILGRGPDRPEIELVAPFSYRLLTPADYGPPGRGQRSRLRATRPGKQIAVPISAAVTEPTRTPRRASVPCGLSPNASSVTNSETVKPMPPSAPAPIT